MPPPIVDFTALGSPRATASAIERFAAERRVVTALVVPWESDDATVRMAVTSTTSDGWAIEHTNLGTVSLADAGGERTRVVVVADAARGANSQDGAVGPAASTDEREALLVAFARQIEIKLAAASPEPVDTRPSGQP
jgi:hypothetical protein